MWVQPYLCILDHNYKSSPSLPTSETIKPHCHSKYHNTKLSCHSLLPFTIAARLTTFIYGQTRSASQANTQLNITSTSVARCTVRVVCTSATFCCALATFSPSKSLNWQCVSFWHACRITKLSKNFTLWPHYTPHEILPQATIRQSIAVSCKSVSVV